jgi:hypothetical protein
MSFITESLRRLNDLKVFWISYTDAGILTVLDYARTLTPSERRGPNGESRIHVLHHTDAALLMLHLYQQIRKTIPPANAFYPATTQLSTPPLPPADPIWDTSGDREREQLDAQKERREVHYRDFHARLLKHIKGDPNESGKRPSGNPLCVATSAEHVAGVTSVCERVFRELEPDFVCMWIEMNDIYSIDELFEIIQESAYFKLGQRDWTPLYAADDHRPRDLEIERISYASSKPLLVFINARETPGSNRNFADENANGWLDLEWRGLDTLLREIEQASDGRFKVVLLARDSSSPLVTRPQRFVSNIVSLSGTPNNNAKATIDSVMNWVTTDPNGRMDRSETETAAALRFLHTLAMMQRSRHLAITWSRCASQSSPTIQPLGIQSNPDPPNRDDEERDRYWSEFDKKKPTWLKDLEKLGLLRRKDGGFIWMHARLRKELRKRLVSGEPKYDGPPLGCEERAEIQQQIASWYLKLFDATNSPPAIFEAVDHLCSSAAHLIVGAMKNGANEEVVDKSIPLAKRRVDTARHLLEEHSFLIFSQGYPRACARRLDKISSFWNDKQWMAQALPEEDRSRPILTLLKIIERQVEQFTDSKNTSVRDLQIAISRLRCSTLEINVMVAREIGENNVAYAAMNKLALEMEGSPDALPHGLTRRRAERIYGWRLQLRLHQRVSWGLRCRERGSMAARPWMQWWFRCGMLGIASRSFKEAERSLYRAVSIAVSGSLRTPAVPDGDFISQEAWDQLLKEIKFDYQSNSPRGRKTRRSDFYLRYRPGIYALEETAYLLILWAGAEHYHDFLLTSSPDPKKREGSESRKQVADNRLKLAERIALKGLVLIEQIQDSGVEREDHDRHLMGNKSRLLQLAGLASRYDPERKPNSRHAMSMMGDAAAALNEAEPLFANAEHAVIDLRRAEVRLSEASNINVFGKRPFGTWIFDRLIGTGINSPVEQNVCHCEKYATTPTTPLEAAQHLKDCWINDRSNQRKIRDELSKSDRDLASKEISLAVQATNLARDEFQRFQLEQSTFEEPLYKPDHRKNSLDQLECQTLQNTEARRDLQNQINSDKEQIEKQERELQSDENRASNSPRKDLAEVASRAYDAIRFLDRAELILRERRRNVNWTTYYFELRLRAISLILWSSIVFEEYPIPYLGLEAAMRLTETEPDQLLRDAGRMIRVDSYRMARIVLAYASCARALEIRLALDRSAVRLPERLKQMHDNLDQAVRQLKELIDRRQKATLRGGPQANPDPKAKVADVVEEVVNEILDRVKLVVSGLATSVGEQIKEQELVDQATKRK